MRATIRSIAARGSRRRSANTSGALLPTAYSGRGRFASTAPTTVAATLSAEMPFASLALSLPTMVWYSARNGDSSPTYWVRRSLMPVLIEPGSTVVTPTPKGDTSRRTASAKPFIAALVATYEERYASGKLASIEPTMTTRPYPRERIPGSTSWVRRTAPNTFRRNTRSTASMGSSSTGPFWLSPALLTSTSTSPAALAQASTDS